MKSNPQARHGAREALEPRAMKPVRIGLLGLGTVGGGVVNVLTRNADEIQRRLGRRLEIVHAAAKDYDADAIQGLESIGRITNKAFSVVEDPAVDVVIELIGGYSPARQLVMSAIAGKKHVVTANKALLAAHGNEIFAAAREHGVMVAYEAAVGGGIPIIKALREGLAANRIQWLAGVINGTSNFILSEMRTRGRSFAEALQEAQALGYAEADPTLDVDGIDAAHKLTIMGALAFGVPLQQDKVYVEGIANVAQEDVACAAELGYRVKHLGIAARTAAGVELRVHPALVPEERLLAGVEGVMNAVLVQGDAVGPTLYYGAGAGSLPTASAVAADVIDVVRALGTAPQQRVPHLAFQPDAGADLPVLSMRDTQCACYLRWPTSDRPAALAAVEAILKDLDIGIDTVVEKEPDADQASLILMTQSVRERDLNDALRRIASLDVITGKVRRLRVAALD